MAKTKKKVKKAEFAVPRVKEDATMEEKLAVANWFRDFSKWHVLIGKKPTKNVLKTVGAKLTKTEMSEFNSIYDESDEFFHRLPDSFFTEENIEKLRVCGNLYFDLYKPKSKYQIFTEQQLKRKMKVYKKVFNIELDYRLELEKKELESKVSL